MVGYSRFLFLDGKIVEWDTTNYNRLRIIQTGIYRVTSLIGVSPLHLWAGFSTGKICVYDLSNDPVDQIKEFQAYSSASIQGFSSSDKAVLESGRYPIFTLSENGEILEWDGFLTDDWIGNL